MHSSLSLLILIYLATVVSYHQSDAQRPLYDTLVIFGDSNSDNGNVYKISNFTTPLSPYFQGRFSNDYVWAERLNISQKINHAYGGATTDNDLVQGFSGERLIPVPGVRQQMMIYARSIQSNTINFDRTVYIIWAGGNNFLRNPTAGVSTITQSISNTTGELIVLGAKHIIIFNQPPLQAVPYVQLIAGGMNLAQLTSEYNANLSQNIAVLQQNNRERDLQVFDLHALISKVLANASSYGIQNSVAPCLTQTAVGGNVTVCSNPNSYAFFDDVHFTGRMHQIIADGFRERLISTSDGHLSSASIFIVFSAVVVLLMK